LPLRKSNFHCSENQLRFLVVENAAKKAFIFIKIFFGLLNISLNFIILSFTFNFSYNSEKKKYSKQKRNEILLHSCLSSHLLGDIRGDGRQ